MHVHCLPTLLFLTTASIAPTVMAQTVAIVPRDHQAREGSTSTTTWPFSAGVSRAQMIYSNWRFDVPNAAQIRRVGVRPDVAGSGAGKIVQLEVVMGHGQMIGSATSTTFATNYVAPATVTYTPKQLSLPTIGSASSGPQTTYVWVPLDTPFQYDATKNLIVEYRVSANNNGNAAFSYRMDVATAVSTATTYGTACATSGARLPTVAAGSALVGSNWNVTIAAGPASSAGVLILGASNTTYGGLPLPLALDALGATGCTLHASLDATLPAVTNTSGNGTVTIPVPNQAPLTGATLFVQAALADIFANQLGLVTSRSASATIGILPQSTLISATGSSTVLTGSRTASFGLVSVFEY